MRFFENLGKGLIRSAVNQIGRDGGRVVSNQLYGDAHSTPHRIVNNNAKPVIDGDDYVAQYAKEQTMTGVILRVIFAFFFNILGAAVLLVYGLKKKSKSAFSTVYRYEQIPTYVKDGRCRGGVRYTGDMTVKKKYYSEADENTAERNKRIANIYIYSSIVILAIYIIMAVIMELQK